MSDIRETIEKADAITWEPTEEWRAVIHDLLTEALTQLDELERDHEALKVLLRKALTWEGRMNAAEQSLIQGHKREAIDVRVGVTKERNEAKAILGGRESSDE